MDSTPDLSRSPLLTFRHFFFFFFFFFFKFSPFVFFTPVTYSTHLGPFFLRTMTETDELIPSHLSSLIASTYSSDLHLRTLVYIFFTSLPYIHPLVLRIKRIYGRDPMNALVA